MRLTAHDIHRLFHAFHHKQEVTLTLFDGRRVACDGFGTNGFTSKSNSDATRRHIHPDDVEAVTADGGLSADRREDEPGLAEILSRPRPPRAPWDTDPDDHAMDPGGQAANAELLARLKAAGPTVASEYEGELIFRSADGRYFFVDQGGTLSHLARVAEVDLPALGIIAATQLAVWDQICYLPGVNSHLFWKVLFPLHGVVLSDGEQTRSGGSFWSNRVNRALYEGFHVYFVDVNAGSSLKVEDMKRFNLLFEPMHGPDRRAHDRRAPLPATGKCALRLQGPRQSAPRLYKGRYSTSRHTKAPPQTAVRAWWCVIPSVPGRAGWDRPDTSAFPRSLLPPRGNIDVNPHPNHPCPAKVLVIADVHHRTAVADAILAAEEPFSRAVFLGDLFDDFGDRPAEALATARWLKARLTDPRLIFLRGNHDLPYAFPGNAALWCPGFSRSKAAATAEVLGPEHWERFTLCHFEGPWLLSHAGFHPSMLPGLGPNWQKSVETDAAATLQALASPWRRHGEEPPPALLAWGRDRGGEAAVGGVTWLDWSRLEPIAGVHQIVGHTPAREALRQRHAADGASSLNFCLDDNTTGTYAVLHPDGSAEFKGWTGSAGCEPCLLDWANPHSTSGPPPATSFSLGSARRPG